MVLRGGTPVILLADQDHLLVLQVTLENGLVPTGAGHLCVGRGFRCVARVLHIALVVVGAASLRGLLLDDDVALRLQSLLLDEVGLVLQYFLCFLLVDAGPPVGWLVPAVREVARTPSASTDLRIRRQDGAAGASRLTLFPRELVLLVVATVALAASVT